MRVHLSRRYHFAAAHRLHAPSLDEAANRAAYGKCNNPHGHGHNYVAIVTLSGTPDPVTGMLVDLAVLDRFAQQHLLDRFDHQNLNLLPAFAACVPTTENLAVEVHRIFAAFPHARLERVHVEETSNNSFSYAAGKLPADF